MESIFKLHSVPQTGAEGHSSGHSLQDCGGQVEGQGEQLAEQLPAARVGLT